MTLKRMDNVLIVVDDLEAAALIPDLAPAPGSVDFDLLRSTTN